MKKPRLAVGQKVVAIVEIQDFSMAYAVVARPGDEGVICGIGADASMGWVQARFPGQAPGRGVAVQVAPIWEHNPTVRLVEEPR